MGRDGWSERADSSEGGGWVERGERGELGRAGERGRGGGGGSSPVLVSGRASLRAIIMLLLCYLHRYTYKAYA